MAIYTPLVSVIIPTYNRKETAKEAVQSILKQDYPKVEVIVVDDGSTDGTREEISRVFGSRVHYIFQENAGKSRARNKGVIESQGELVCFLDSDDILVPGSISARVQCFRENDKCRVSYGTYVEEKNYDRREFLLKQEYPSGYILKELLLGLFIHNNSFMLSRKDMQNYGMYREDLMNHEDRELFVRLTQKLYFSYCGALCTVLRNRGQRARHSFEEIIMQGTKDLDYIFADPTLASALAGEKARLYSETYLRMAKASLRRNLPREFRRYFKMARVLQHRSPRIFKFWRRWLFSWVGSLWYGGK